MTINGLKKAVGNYKQVNAGGYYSPHYGNLMFDKSTGKLWCDEYYDLGHGSYTAYNSDDIINLGAKMNDAGIAINMQNVKNYIESNF